jgi:hypothetical protein
MGARRENPRVREKLTGNKKTRSRPKESTDQKQRTGQSESKGAPRYFL